MKCPICNHDLGWMSSENACDISEEYKGSEVVNYYTCQHCGASIEVWECRDEDKKDYKYWDDGKEIE